MRHEEWHVTVDGINPMLWEAHCRAHGWKPLYIELTNGRRQLMLATPDDPRCEMAGYVTRGWYTLARVKHEVSDVLPGETACYWEAHYKIDGEWMDSYASAVPAHDFHLAASRDLYRLKRSYVTRRERHRFDPQAGVAFEYVKFSLGPHRTLVGVEYEACLLDTNPGLDDFWIVRDTEDYA